MLGCPTLPIVPELRGVRGETRRVPGWWSHYVLCARPSVKAENLVVAGGQTHCCGWSGRGGWSAERRMEESWGTESAGTDSRLGPRAFPKPDYYIPDWRGFSDTHSLAINPLCPLT